MNRHIGYKILVAVVLCVLAAMTSVALFFTQQQERSILAQNEQALIKLTEATSQSVQTIMLAGYADIALSLSNNLKGVDGVEDFRILHRAGFEAFHQNATIDEVNQRIGEEEFLPRDSEERIEVLASDSPQLQQALSSLDTQVYEEHREDGGHFLTVLTPIENQKDCQRCHGSDHKVRGLIKLTTSLAPVQQEIRHTWIGMLAVMALITVLVILVIGYLVRRLSLPVLGAAKEMAAIASGEGDLTVSLPVKGQDEVAALAAGFNTFVSKIRSTLREVAEQAVSLEALSNRVQEIASRTSATAAEQRLQVESAVASVSQMSATTAAVAASTEGALEQARQVEQLAEQGSADVNASIGVTRALKAKIGSANQAMDTLGDDVEQIGSILNLIQGIADQTNLLALNAAIEAARAGDHGRGFSVVADEVRTLAQKTASSVVDIHALISQLQLNTQSATGLMEACSSEAESSINQAEKSGQSLAQITTAAHLIVELNRAVATAMEESSRSTEAINAAIVGISEEAATTSEQAESGSEQSQQLTVVVHRLEALVSQFRV